MTKKLFASLPMRDRDIDEIRSDMEQMLAIVEDAFDEECEIIDTCWVDEKPPVDVNDEGCWYLGKSIMALADADIAVFHPDWRDARGCIIEHMVCALYNIPYVDISANSLYDNDDDEVIDNTHDWRMVGEYENQISQEIEESLLDMAHDDVDDLVDSDPDLNPDISEDSLAGMRHSGNPVDDFYHDDLE